MEVALSANDKKWRAEDDARTLAQSEVIVNDPDRLRLAKDAAKKMAEEQVEQAKAMSKIAGGKKVSPRTDIEPNKGILRDGTGDGFNVFQDVTKR